MSTAHHSSSGSHQALDEADADNEHAVYLQLDAFELFGFYHSARAEAPRQAVLICPPFGWEEVCSYRSRRLLAQLLAAAGHPTLRIDLPGTADSPDPAGLRAGLAAWSAAATASARWLASASGVPAVAAVGIGLGGLVLCDALGAGADIDELVLWHVPSRGRAFVRELRAFARMEQSALALDEYRPGQRAAATPNLEGATVEQPTPKLEAGGFGLEPDTVAELEAFDVEQLPHEVQLKRALLLGRDGVPADERLHAQLAQRGVEVADAPGEGYAAMVAEPQLARAPLASFEAVLAWLHEEAGFAVGRRPGPPRARAAAAPAPKVACAPASQTGGVRERPLEIRSPPGTLFGILSEPGAREAEPLAAVLLNAGAIRRIGPNRLWVELAREWASRGICTLRLDFEGIGDAFGEGDRSPDLAALYAGELAGQVHAAIDAVEGATGAQRFVLAGLCSGAYWSFHAALREQRVSAALLLNPQTLFWDPAEAARRDLRHTLLQRSSWSRLLSGKSSRERVAQLLRALAPGARDLGKRARSRLSPDGGSEREPLEQALRSMHREGKRLLFAFSGKEPLYEQMRQDGSLAQLERWPNVELVSLAGSDHTLRPAAARADARRTLTDALAQELSLAGCREGELQGR